MALLYQTGLLTTLAYLLGERTVNSSTSAPRADFLQETLKEAYAADPWRFARTNATLTITSGIATLPTDYDDNHTAHIKFANGDSEFELEPVDPDDSELTQQGSRHRWVETTDSDPDRYVLRTKDTDVSPASIRYQKRPPELDSDDTIGTPYPNKITLALGARRYVKLGQNPDADISQDEAIFEKRIAADIAAHQVPAPRKNRKSRQTQTGSSTGEF